MSAEKQTRRIGDGTPGPGRKKGVPNKVTTALREAILLAAEKSDPEGAVGYLTKQAKDNPVAFMGLLGKVLPLQVAGDPSNPIRHEGMINIIVRGKDA